MISLARFILNKKYPILFLIVFITLFLGYHSFQIKLNQNPDELIYKDDPEYPLLKAFFEEFGYDELVVVVFSSENILKKEKIEIINEITDQLTQIKGIDKVVSLSNAEDIIADNGSITIDRLVKHLPDTEAEGKDLLKKINTHPIYSNLLISKNAECALFDISLAGTLTNDERVSILNSIEKIFSKHSTNSNYYMSGSPVGRSEMFKSLRRDFATLFPMGMLLMIVIMYFIFRSYLCIVLSFISILLSVIWTVGYMYLSGSELNFLSVLIPTILFIMGTSDCVHVLSQYQDCRYTCKTKGEALTQTIQLMFFPCFLTTITTMVGFFSLNVSTIEPIKLFGFFSAMGCAFAFILSITLLPIGLSLGDTKPFSLNKPYSEKLLLFLNKIYNFQNQKKILIFIFSLIFIVVGLFGMTKLHVETDLENFFVNRTKFTEDTLYIENTFGGIIPFFVIIEGDEEDALTDPDLLKKIDQLTEFIRSQDGVDKVISPSDFIKYINFRLNDNKPSFYKIPDTRKQIAELLLMASLSDNSEILSRLFDDSYMKTNIGIRFRYHDFYRITKMHEIVRSHLKELFTDTPDVKAYSTGTSMLIANTLIPVMKGLKHSLVFALIAIFILMIILFRSMKLALISMVPNVTPIIFTLGLMGILDISLNFGTAPIAAITLGLAIDDTIHFLTRFKIEFYKNHDYTVAAKNTLISVGKPIIITSIILSIGFSIFFFSNFHFTRNMGILISFTVISAIFADLILLPVLLTVFKPLKDQSSV